MHITTTQAVLFFLAAVSIVSILVTIADKVSAVMHARRVPEATLLLLSALGGSAAMYLTMIIIRHKTRKLKFMLGIPLIMLLQAAAAGGVWILSGQPSVSW